MRLTSLGVLLLWLSLPTPAGLAWEAWVGNRWHTRATLTSDAAGRVAWRGFKGTYRLTENGQATPRFHPGTATSPASVKLP